MHEPAQIEKTNETFDPIGTNTLEAIARADRFNKWMYETIKPFLLGSILEIGSGLGNISKFAIKDQLKITLSDFNLDYCRRLEDSFGHHDNVQSVCSIDLQHPNFCKYYSEYYEKYDTVFLLNVIERLENDINAIENCRYMLKPQGTLVVLAPAYPYLFSRFDKELGHYRRYTLKTLSSVIRKNSFELIHKQYFNLAGLGAWFIFGKVLKRKMIGKGEMSLYNKWVPVFKMVDNITMKKAGLSAIVVGKKSEK